MAQGLGDRILAQAAVLLGPSNPDSLENRICSAVSDGAVCFVIDQKAFYYFVKRSTTPPSGVEVIATGQGASVPGRWFLLNVVGAVGATGATGATGNTGPAGPIVPISRKLVVDSNGSLTGTGAFSGATCFREVTDAVAAAPSTGLTEIIIAPGDYSAEGTIAWNDKELCFIGASLAEPDSNFVSLPTLEPASTGGRMLLLLQCVSTVVMPDNAVDVMAINCAIDAQGDSLSSYNMQGSPESSLFRNTTGGSAVGQLTARGTTLGSFTATGPILVTSSVVTGDVHIGNGGAVFEQCDMVGPASVFAGSSAVVKMDRFSLATARQQSFQTGLPNNTGTVEIIDAPLTPGIVFAVPALSGSTADVTASLPNARPGDQFDITTNGSLAGVGIVDAWCSVSGQVTVRFIGTTAGGNATCDVSICVNSGA